MISTLNIRNDASRLYYEAHVTLSQGAFTMGRQTTEALNSICDRFDMRVSAFLLVKPEDEEPQAFISARDPSYRHICERVLGAIEALQEEGFEILRWKIEDTVLDSKRGDDVSRLREAVVGSLISVSTSTGGILSVPGVR